MYNWYVTEDLFGQYNFGFANSFRLLYFNG